MEMIAREWQETGKAVIREGERIRFEEGKMRTQMEGAIRDSLKRMQDGFERDEAESEVIRKENDELRQQLADLRAEIESEAWNTVDQIKTSKTEEEGLHLPNLDAFNDLINVCKAVKSLQENLENLTMQADQLNSNEPAPNNPEEEPSA
jgi:hypothetical protein